MNVSAISINDSNQRRNLFIKYANSFMSFGNQNAVEKSQKMTPADVDNKANKIKGIETLTIFPKQVIDGKTIITA